MKEVDLSSLLPRICDGFPFKTSKPFSRIFTSPKLTITVACRYSSNASLRKSF